MSDKKRMAINMISQFISFVIGLGISFILTRQIAKLLGKDVYGFVGLANTVTSYVTVFVVALNSMLNRYVTIALKQKRYDSASTYFSSVVIANTVISAILVIPAAIIIIFLEQLFDVPAGHVGDIKLLWFFIFANFLFGMCTSAFGAATYATNRLDLAAKRTVEGNIIKAVILIIAYMFFEPKVWYLGLSIFACGLYGNLTNISYRKKLTPELQIKKMYYKFSAVKELVGVGIWSSVNQLTQTLINGLDLVFANKFLGALEMSLMSYSKNVPVQLLSLIGMVSSVFAPKMTLVYAEGDMEKFKKTVNTSLKICGFFCSVPILGFIAFGSPFFRLWLNVLTNEEIRLIQVLSILTLLPTMFSVYIYPLYTVNTITRKLKIPVLVSLGIGIVNLIMVPVLIQVTDLGLLAIKIVSSVLLTARVLIFVPIYAAYSINSKWTTFYKPLVHGVISSCIILVIYYQINRLVDIQTWGDLIVVAAISGVIGYLVNYFIVLSKEEKHEIIQIVKRKLKKKRL